MEYLSAFNFQLFIRCKLLFVIFPLMFKSEILVLHQVSKQSNLSNLFRLRRDIMPSLTILQFLGVLQGMKHRDLIAPANRQFFFSVNLDS